MSENAYALDAGNWHGNDSAWRMTIDLLRILLFADDEGVMRFVPARKMFSLVDGVVGGEGDGPLAPERKRCGTFVAGYNPVAVDMVAARLMGFDWRKIKMLKYSIEHPEEFLVRTEEIILRDVDRGYGNLLAADNKNPNLRFTPPTGWKGFVEI